MDQVKINLPCGFETTYGKLRNCEKVVRCMMCEEEDLNIDSVLKLPANQVRLKEKQIELELVKLEKLENEIQTIGKDPHFHVEKSYEQIFNQMDLRREKLKIEFEKKLDEYLQLRSEYEEKKKLNIKKLEQNLNQNYVKIDVLPKKHGNFSNIQEKIDTLETDLKRISQKTDYLSKVIVLSKIGENQELLLVSEYINIKEMFGEIHASDMRFDYKLQVVLGGQFNSQKIQCIQNVDENTLLFGLDENIKLWHIDNRKCLKTFTGHSKRVVSLCMLETNRFASCSLDKLIKIWNIKSGESVKTLLDHNQSVLCLKYLSNGQLASCSTDKTIKIWNYESGKCIRTLTGHEKSVNLIELGPKNTIISSSLDKTIKIWNLETGENLKTLKGHLNEVYFLKTMYSTRLISGSYDNTIKYWDLESGQCIQSFLGFSGIPGPMAMLKNGHLITCCEEGTIKIWDLDLKECLKVLKIFEPIDILFLTKDEEIILTTKSSQMIILSL
ncbi:unnamed protein product [Brachionus calyciflorus]|uniref:Uncharacterized protein n=1 Tax=Brachionus calyciflorus TaxID=104777 RepID=A0A813R5J5_9BILA|nr:unnamed protein product [Brachionus calyciflorus]